MGSDEDGRSLRVIGAGKAAADVAGPIKLGCCLDFPEFMKKPILGLHVGICEGHPIKAAIFRIKANLGQVENVLLEAGEVDRDRQKTEYVSVPPHLERLKKGDQGISQGNQWQGPTAKLIFETIWTLDEM